MERVLKDLLHEIKKYNRSADFKLLERAYYYAKSAHDGQKRSDGSDFFTHPVAVAQILAELKLDGDVIIAALLHDVVEDTDVTIEDIKEIFGEGIAAVVEGVTKLTMLPYSSKEEQQAESLRKMFIAMESDVSVAIIKIADRLHNMRTIEYLSEEKQREKARETLHVYAQMAQRLGMFGMKWELEDLSLRYIDPVSYYEIVGGINAEKEEREEFIETVKGMLKKRLNDLRIKAEIDGRAKHIYSIFQKVYVQGKSIDEVHDKLAIRIIVNSEEECYAVLGIVHAVFKSMNIIKDYINLPKPNMYQSLHTIVIGPNGEIFEVQIRTKEMHETAEKGIAAHWNYKLSKIKSKKDIDPRLSWIKDLQKNLTKADDIMQVLRTDVLSDRIVALTPKGDIKNLPVNSTIIDFAYEIHSSVGNQMISAKVNGRIVTLDYRIKNGDIINIITSPNAAPSRDWLRIAVTTKARGKINQWFKKEEREENIIRGKSLLEKTFKKYGISHTVVTGSDYAKDLLSRYGFHTVDDFIATLGYGSNNANKVLMRLKEMHIKNSEVIDDVSDMIIKTTNKPNSSGILVNGMDNCYTRISHCCNPVPGDDIVGYLTRGRGVTVHRSDCNNVANITEDERFVPVRWMENHTAGYQAVLCITGNDRDGLIHDVTSVMKDLKLPILGFSARTGKDSIAIIDAVVEIKNSKHLEASIRKLENIPGIISVIRRKQ